MGLVMGAEHPKNREKIPIAGIARNARLIRMVIEASNSTDETLIRIDSDWDASNLRYEEPVRSLSFVISGHKIIAGRLLTNGAGLPFDPVKTPMLSSFFNYGSNQKPVRKLRNLAWQKI